MDSDNRSYLEKLPLIIARWSKATLAALKEQVIETIRAVSELLNAIVHALDKFAKWARTLFLQTAKLLWSAYYGVETCILETAVDMTHTIIAMRFFLVIVLVAVVLTIFRLWILLFIYVTFLALALTRKFRQNLENIDQENNYGELRYQWVKQLRWPMRFVATLVSLCLSVFLWSASWWPQLEKAQSEFETEASTKALAPPASLAAPTIEKNTSSTLNPKSQEVPQPPYDTISLNNECSKDIFVAVHYSDRQTGWITKGWYVVKGNKTVMLNLQSTGSHAYFYGRAADGSEWTADDDEDGGSWSVGASKVFSYKEGESLNDSNTRAVNFFSVESDEVYGSVLTASFVCS